MTTDPKTMAGRTLLFWQDNSMAPVLDTDLGDYDADSVQPSITFEDSSEIKYGLHSGHECLIAYTAQGEVDGTW